MTLVDLARLGDAVLDAMPGGVIVVDGEGRVVRRNAAASRWLGAEVVRRPIATWVGLWGDARLDGVTAAEPGDLPIARALRGEVCDGAEQVCLVGAAAGTHVLVTAAPLRDVGGHQIGAVMTIDDLTALRRARERTDLRLPLPAPPSAPVTTATVLVVDSEDAARAEAAAILRSAGFAVVEATSAAGAQRAVASTGAPIDVLLTDVALEDDTGPELAHHLLQVLPGMAVLYMSDHPWGALVPGASSRRGRGLLRKPFSGDDLIAAVAAATAPAERVAGAVRDERQGRVLLVEDEDQLREAEAALLRDEGFEVAEAADGVAAGLRMAEAGFDVVVSDINMPGITGLDLLKQVRSLDVDVPVVLMTAAPNLVGASTAVEYGAFRYLAKPVDGDELLRVVQHAVRSGRLARLKRDAQVMTGHDGWRPGDLAGLEVQFDRALANLWLEFQPIFRVAEGKVRAFEVLVRTSELAMRDPAALRDAAERLGRGDDLGRQIRHRAAAAVAAAPASTLLFVNISAADLDDPGLYAAEAPLSAVADRVVLELNERDAVAPGLRLEQQIKKLRALGYRLAIDDLGAGHVGLSAFSILSPEVVKLDASLVRDVHATAPKRSTIAAMTEVCHDLGIEVVAEGVEVAAERDCLVDLGCDLLQGHLFARPTRDFVIPVW